MGLKVSGSCFLLKMSLYLSLIRRQRSQETTGYENMIPPLYNKLEAPESDGEPVHVYMFLQVMDLDEIDESKMDFRIQFYLDDIWRDNRLKLDGFNTKKIRMLPEQVANNIWKPDIVFDNAKSGDIFKLSIPNTFVKVLPDGSLYRTARYNLRVTCRMSLENYPMDTQQCDMTIASLSYPMTSMELHWVQEPDSPYSHFSDNITFTNNFAPLKYEIESPRAEKRIEQWASGNYTFLIANFTFVRSVSSHVVNTYIPSTLVVIMSWLSFWLDVSVAPGRVTLGVTSLLTLATQGVRSRSQLPPVSYMTALDIWLFFCVIMVFASLVEYAVAYHIAALQDKRKETRVCSAGFRRVSSRTMHREIRPIFRSKIMSREEVEQETITQSSVDKIKISIKKLLKKWFQPTVSLDIISRIVFPSLFGVFCIVYWFYYLWDCL